MRTEAWSAGVKTLALTLEGQAITEDVVSLTYTDDINGASDPKIGSTCAARLAMVIQKPRHTFGGKTLAVSVGGVPLGVFTVTTTRAQDERVEIEALDAMDMAFEGAFTPASSTSTALTVVRAVCAAAGVTVGDVSGVTDVPVSGLKAGHTRREILGLMAALLGRNAHIDREGRLCLRWYASSGVAVTADGYYPGALQKADGDYAVARIECTVTTMVEETEEDTTTEDTETTVYAAGTGQTGISLTDEYMTQTILDGVFAEIGGLVYRPMTVTFYGDARIETGDLITVTDGAGTSYTVPVMAVTHAWDGGVRTTVTAVGDPAEGLSRSPAGVLSKSVSNLMAEFARFRNLEAENIRALRAKIRSIEVGDINLYGLMTVFKDSTLSSEGGHMGYGTGGVLGDGVAIEAKALEYTDPGGGEPPIPAVGESGSVVLAGTKGVFLGFHGETDPWFDGGSTEIYYANYPHYLQITDSAILLNGVDVLAAIERINARLVGENLMSATVWKSSGTLALSKPITGYKKVFVILGSPASAGYGTSGAYVLSWQGNNFAANQRYTFPCYNGYVSLFITDANTVTIEHADMPVRMLVGYTEQ